MSDAERQAARRQRVKEAEITIERARPAAWEAVILAAQLQESLKWGERWKIKLDADRLCDAVRTIHTSFVRRMPRAVPRSLLRRLKS